ncbi:MAG TPA: pyruvate formate lyase family protein [Ruminiclostridium sp.]
MIKFQNETKTNETYTLLTNHSLHSAALFYLGVNDTPMQRAGRVVKQYFCEIAPPEIVYGLTDCKQDFYNGFIDDKGKECGLYVNILGDIAFDKDKFSKLCNTYKDNTRLFRVMNDLMWDAQVRNYDQAKAMPPRYHHFGDHSVCDIRKILDIGLNGIKSEINFKSKKNNDPVYISFCSGLLDTIDGIEIYIKRCAEEYSQMALQTSDPEIGKIAAAYSNNLVMEPPKTFYEAFLTVLFLMKYMFSEAGRIDQYLYPYYLKDIELGILKKDEVFQLFDNLFKRIDEINRGLAHHIVVGGCDQLQNPSYNEITKTILLVSRKYAQPNISLRVSEKMPDEIWNIVLESLGSGKANPALVYEKPYIEELIDIYKVDASDAIEFGLGGCSETLINGMCNVDGTWVAYNLLDVLHESLGSHLLECNSFEEFYHIFLQDMKKTSEEMIDQINIRQHMDVYKSDPLRTLSHKNCLEEGKSFWNGGAKYNFDSTNIYGATNAINGLVVIKKLFDGELGVDKKSFLHVLDANFTNNQDLFNKIKKAEKFGNNDQYVNDIAKDVMEKLFNMFRGVHCYRGNGYFMPAVIDYLEYDRIGAKMPATADGRLEGAPMVDSIGPVAGTDENGPTSMVNSVVSIPMNLAIGTCVLNIRFDPSCFISKENKTKIRNFIETYFKLGGHQIQVNVVDTELLLKAVENPEEHKDIIVRVGGFTDYFVCLSDQIQQNIIHRTNNSF